MTRKVRVTLHKSERPSQHSMIQRVKLDRCPMCTHYPTVMVDHIVVNNTLKLNMTCKDCGASWVAIYNIKLAEVKVDE